MVYKKKYIAIAANALKYFDGSIKNFTVSMSLFQSIETLIRAKNISLQYPTPYTRVM